MTPRRRKPCPALVAWRARKARKREPMALAFTVRERAAERA